MTCDHVELELDAYVDGELARESMNAVHDHVNGCTTCGGRVAERQALRRLLRAAPYFDAPERLRARVSAGTVRSTSTHRFITWASAAAVLVLAVALGAALVRSRTAGNTVTAGDVVDGHVRSLMADHLFDVRSTDQHTVKPWFLGRLDFAPPVVDLAAAGFPLVGGRLDYIGGRPVAALVYQRQKHTINLFVSPQPGGAGGGIDSQSIRGFHVRHWTRDAMTFWAVSDLNDAELTEFARALRGS